jgi:hypothetical protein
MRTLFFSLVTFFAFVGSHTSAFSASLTLDSFSEGDFLLQNGGDDFWDSDDTRINSPFTERRRVYGGGLGTWSISLEPSSGMLDYSVTEILAGQGTSRFGMTIRYSGTGTVGFLEYDAFQFDFTSVTGTALLQVEVNNQNFDEMIPVTIDSSGELLYPFSNIAANDVSSISDIFFRVTPQSDTFSFSLNEVSVVPEPSALVLFLLGGAGVFWLRRK